jgi:hypothetical protein
MIIIITLMQNQNSSDCRRQGSPSMLMVNISGRCVGPPGNPTLLAAFPEPRAVFGPAGPRVSHATDRSVAPVVTRAPRQVSR